MALSYNNCDDLIRNRIKIYGCSAYTQVIVYCLIVDVFKFLLFKSKDVCKFCFGRMKPTPIVMPHVITIRIGYADLS